MRRRPVTRDEIRFNRKRRITTLPVDAVREDDYGYLVPIHKLWAPLLRALNRAGKRRHEEWQQAMKASEDGRRLMASLRIRIDAPWKPIGLPDRYVWRVPRLRRCQRCAREFYRVDGSNPYCSDTCAEASRHEHHAIRNAAMVKARSEARAAARADRRCAHCGEPITAQRSTNKFCSVRCRVAAHRERKAEQLEKANAELRKEAKGLK